MKEKLKKLLLAKEARKTELGQKINSTEDVKELRAINTELETLNGEITELRGMIDAISDEPPATPPADPETPPAPEQRSAGPVGRAQVLATYGFGTGQTTGDGPEDRAKAHEEAEKRGQALKEGRSVTIASTGVILPGHQATDIRPTFNQVSALIDRVSSKTLIGGESYKQAYVAGYGTGGYTAEGADYTDAEAQFGYAAINKAKITAYAEDSEELLKLPAADYDGEVQKGIRIASRKLITREILIGAGATNQLAGIFTAAATAIDAATDLSLTTVDDKTLDEIIFSFGGDEDVEDAAVLILNKKDLKAFSRLRTTDGKKFHTIVTNGNSGTIDGIPFIINSACKAVSDAATTVGQYAMAYGPLSNYLLTIFSDLDIQRSTDYKFKQGMIAHRSSVFAGGNVISKNGFLRIKKGPAA